MMVITIERRLPVINGFVRIPDVGNRALTSLTPAAVESLIPVSSESTIVDQNFVAFPAYYADEVVPEDYFGTLREAV
ncbi:MAG: hypothetical protein GF411_14310 [Candidatus Lokiarchaeota archaeon]|nr:hypothetical protein [Candidatus Lokiarchaeota archaeon]